MDQMKAQPASKQEEKEATKMPLELILALPVFMLLSLVFACCHAALEFINSIAWDVRYFQRVLKKEV